MISPKASLERVQKARTLFVRSIHLLRICREQPILDWRFGKAELTSASLAASMRRRAAVAPRRVAGLVDAVECLLSAHSGGPGQRPFHPQAAVRSSAQSVIAVDG